MSAQGMAAQAVAKEIVDALLADEKDGGFDLTAGLFGRAFSTLVRRFAAVELKLLEIEAAHKLVDSATPQHPDDAAVDALALLMKAKLAKQRAKGYGGWDDKTKCSQGHLSDLLRGHVDKGDPVDVANFCAMLSARGEGVAAEPQALSVTNILLRVVPGLDGMGHEVYATSVKDVEDVLTEMAQRLEDWELGIKRLDTTQPAAQGPMTVIAREQWEPCSPSYLQRGGCCASAPRVWDETGQNHWHPKLPGAANQGDAG